MSSESENVPENANDVDSFYSSLGEEPVLPRYSIAIVGPTGSGKTSLAILISDWIASHRRKRICLIEAGETGAASQKNNELGIRFYHREALGISGLVESIDFAREKDFDVIMVDGVSVLSEWLIEASVSTRLDRLDLKERIGQERNWKQKDTNIDLEVARRLAEASGESLYEIIGAADTQIQDYQKVKNGVMRILDRLRSSGKSFVMTARATALMEEVTNPRTREKELRQVGWKADCHKSIPFEPSLVMLVTMQNIRGTSVQVAEFSPEPFKCRVPIGRIRPVRIEGTNQLGDVRFLSTQDLMPVLEHAILLGNSRPSDSEDSKRFVRQESESVAASRKQTTSNRMLALAIGKPDLFMAVTGTGDLEAAQAAYNTFNDAGRIYVDLCISSDKHLKPPKQAGLALIKAFLVYRLGEDRREEIDAAANSFKSGERKKFLDLYESTDQSNT